MRQCRDFALRDQMQRAAVSIPSNIAEGSERGGRDFIRFLRVARGSAAELRTQCYIAAEIGILTEDRAQYFVAELKDGRQLVVEYKGAHIAEGPDTAEKRNIGAKLEEVSGRRTLFLMAEKRKGGLDMTGQLQAKIGGKTL